MTDKKYKVPKENKTQIQADSDVLNHGQSANYFKRDSSLAEDDCKSL